MDFEIKRPPHVIETERQVAELEKLDDAALVSKALECLHILNRRAKEKRERIRYDYDRGLLRSEIRYIYKLKNRFLKALVETGRATVFSFGVADGMRCPTCDFGWPAMALKRCLSCGNQAEEHNPTWYVVECGEYRFHQPGETAPEHWKDIAKPIEPRDPYQPFRGTPQSDLTVRALYDCVGIAISRMEADHG